MNLLRKNTSRFAALFLFAALLPALCGCHDAGNCVTAPTVVPNPGPGGTAPILGAAGTFGVLGGQSVSNTGALTTIAGDVGVSPGNTINGIPAGQPTGGTIHSADATATNAQGNLTTAYTDLAGRPCNVPMSGIDLGGRTLSANVYCYSSSAQLTGTLTLDGQGNSNAIFIFQIASALTTAPSAAVVLTGGALARNVYWQVGSSATLDTGTSFVGTIIALQDLTMNTGATLNGRALARNGNVTLDTNAITVP